MIFVNHWPSRRRSVSSNMLVFLCCLLLSQNADAWRYSRGRSTDFGIDESEPDVTETTPTYTCPQDEPQCTRVYTCGDTTYACSVLYDIAIIQFNKFDTPCGSIVPLDSSTHNFEYCGQLFSDETAVLTADCNNEDYYYIDDGIFDCGTLCDLDNDSDINAHICPNGVPIDFYFTVCNADTVNQFSTHISEDDILNFDASLHERMESSTNLFEFNGCTGLYDAGQFGDPVGHSSCFNFGEVSCCQDELTCMTSTLPPTPPPTITSTPPPTATPTQQPTSAPTVKQGKKGKKGISNSSFHE